MSKIVIDGPGHRHELPELLEGYLHGLGEACHRLFGADGETAMYVTIGHFFNEYIQKQMHVVIEDKDPWKRYCRIVEVFTKHGFYGHVELEQRGANSYWMLETDQYAGQVWQDQQAWERGSPPCPLWTLILSLLADIDCTIVFDSVSGREDVGGYESTFHFERIRMPHADVIGDSRRKMLDSLITFCCRCKKVRDENGEWIPADQYLYQQHDANISHGYCPECEEFAIRETQHGVSKAFP